MKHTSDDGVHGHCDFVHQKAYMNYQRDSAMQLLRSGFSDSPALHFDDSNAFYCDMAVLLRAYDENMVIQNCLVGRQSSSWLPSRWLNIGQDNCCLHRHHVPQHYYYHDHYRDLIEHCYRQWRHYGGLWFQRPRQLFSHQQQANNHFQLVRSSIVNLWIESI